MNKGFWDKLQRPILALAPMYDVTDAAFRFVIAKYGKPGVTFTEFTSTDGLQSAGRAKLLHHLKFDQSERPVVAQIFGTKPEKFEQTAKDLVEMGFDGIDINMGCPDKNITKTGSCAALFAAPDLAKEIILATKRGAGSLPVSVKIRIGDTRVDWEKWILTLLAAKPAAISIHLRTRKEMSKVPAHWEEMPKIVKFIHANTTPETRPIILGNGDVQTLEEARQKCQESGCDGVLLGRAIFGNPWLFRGENPERDFPLPTSPAAPASPFQGFGHREVNSTVSKFKYAPFSPTGKEKLEVLLEHTKLYEQMFSGVKPFDIMKRHFKAYTTGLPGAAELRDRLYACNSAAEVEAVLKSV